MIALCKPMSDGFPSPKRSSKPANLPKRARLGDDDQDETVGCTTAVLVYNVSLNDLLVVTQSLPEPSARKEFPKGLPGLARPLFSAQLALAKGIANALGDKPALLRWMEAGTDDSLNVGFEIPDGSGHILDSSELRFRHQPFGDGSPSPLVDSAAETKPPVVAVLFPLLAAVTTAWLRGAASKARRRVVVLASGRAQPRDVGADTCGNSTECTAQLMVRFLTAAYPEESFIAVALHHDGDAFRYDANLHFCHNMLLPILDAEREDVAQESGDGWPDRLSVTLALCDGTHSRLQVLSQSLREYRPEMSHLSPLKAFWHSCSLRPSDVDRESYQRAFEAAPPSDVATLTDPALCVLIAEVIAHRNNFLFAQPREHGRTLKHTLSEAGKAPRSNSTGVLEGGDLECFWLRKTNKPVLSVLLVQREGGPLRMHRGINLEVSMPTGSLCAERNVIGTAFAADPSLRRQDLRAIAVLAVDGDGDIAAGPLRGRNPLGPCGACMEWLRKIYEVNPSFRVLTFQDESCRHVFVKTVGRC